MDDKIKDYNLWLYILRSLAVGVADGTFVIIGGMIANYIEISFIFQII